MLYHVQKMAKEIDLALSRITHYLRYVHKSQSLKLLNSCLPISLNALFKYSIEHGFNALDVMRNKGSGFVIRSRILEVIRKYREFGNNVWNSTYMENQCIYTMYLCIQNIKSYIDYGIDNICMYILDSHCYSN